MLDTMDTVQIVAFRARLVIEKFLIGVTGMLSTLARPKIWTSWRAQLLPWTVGYLLTMGLNSWGTLAVLEGA